MPAKNNTLKFALEFPQGFILFMNDNDRPGSSGVGGIYFQPRNNQSAFSIYAERKELFGKHAVCVSKDAKIGIEAYNVVYEFGGNGALTDARLVKGELQVRGNLVEGAVLEALAQTVAQGKITCHDIRDTAPDAVFNVARFEDGRLLIQLRNNKGLYLGTPEGGYVKLDAQLQVQGGGDRYYRLATGENISLPYGFGGPGRDDIPTFAGEELSYLNVEGGEDPVEFGLKLASGVAHLTPFSPELAAAFKPASLKQPKP